MDFLNSEAFQVIDKLPREITNEELLGRRFYTDIKRRHPKLDTIGEPECWSTYSLRMDPYTISFETLPLLSTVRYRYNKLTNVIRLQFEQDCLPIEVRTLTQHFFKEIEAWQKKKKQNR